MDLIRNQDTNDPNEFIQRYIRDTVRANKYGIEIDHVQDLYQRVKELFSGILSLLEDLDAELKEQVEYISLDRSYSRLILWYDDCQSLRGAPPGSVPQNLTESMARHLKDIGATLIDRLMTLLRKEPTELAIDHIETSIQSTKAIVEMIQASPDDDSDTTDFDYDSYFEIAEDLKTDTTCLMRTNSLLDSTVQSPHITDSASDVPVPSWEPHRPYCERIGIRFPDSIDKLVLRLGKANYDRFLRCSQKRDEISNDDTNVFGPAQKANTAVVSDFHDSGLGSSIPSKSSYAETIMSYGADGNGQSVRVPPLSEDAKKGIPFTCVACFKTVSIKNNSLWKRHLYEDLCPWMCLDPECPSGNSVFSQRNDWLAHISFEHKMAPAWASLQCPLCRENIESGKASITRHLGNHLEEIALGSLPISTEWDKDDDQNSEISVSSGSEFASPKVLPSLSPSPEIPLPKIQAQDNNNADDLTKQSVRFANTTSEAGEDVEKRKALKRSPAFSCEGALYKPKKQKSGQQAAPAVDTSVNVFEFLVANTPNASNLNLSSNNEETQLVRFEREANNYVDPTGYMVDDEDIVYRDDEIHDSDDDNNEENSVDEIEAYQDYEIHDSDDDNNSAADLPPAVDTSVNVFDLLVAATPNASNLNLSSNDEEN
ncbi:hypothetical protein E8E14_005681 [Neopestalotiopsis sp. 37M]|nr:hypothetical protein E8E14_005681 [Neopestalotiopsis sp. 37M]